MFDWICYHTIVSHVYGDNDIEAVTRNHTAEKYKQFMKQQFGKKTIDESLKIDKILKYLRECSVDIFFMQEASHSIVRMIEKKTKAYRIVSGSSSDSIILVSWKLCKTLLGKHAYKTLKFYNDCYLNESQLKDSRESFFTKLKSMEMSKEDSNTHQDSGAFIAIERTFSFEPEVAKNPLEFEALREKEQKEMNDAIYETISSEASSSDDEDEQMQASRERVRKCIDLKWMKSLDNMNFNKNSVVQFLGSLILFSIHLPSEVKNGGLRSPIRARLLNRCLRELYPGHTIIMGGAWNQFLEESEFNECPMFPSNLTSPFTKRGSTSKTKFPKPKSKCGRPLTT